MVLKLVADKPMMKSYRAAYLSMMGGRPFSHDFYAIDDAAAIKEALSLYTFPTMLKVLVRLDDKTRTTEIYPSKPRAEITINDHGTIKNPNIPEGK